MIVLGLGFGDEGKGLTTSYLCSQVKNPIVVRFNGGHQAGHTVYKNGKPHVFSNFGSGTLDAVPTVWSHYCTFSPESFMNEYLKLENAKIYVHALSPVTTPYDIQFNRQDPNNIKNGTCGVGFGATLKRNESHFKLYVQDIFYDQLFMEKLRNISQYYGMENLNIDSYIQSIRHLREIIEVIVDYQILKNYDVVMEGAQGILLDQDFGFYPNVTPSNTTSKNALSIFPSKEIYYVTRTYQTRHGNGFMTNLNHQPALVNHEKETNVLNPHQGEFRKTILDLDLIDYALKCDNHFSSHLKKNLIITCVDQTGESIKVSYKNSILALPVKEIPKALSISFDKVFISKGPDQKDIFQIK